MENVSREKIDNLVSYPEPICLTSDSEGYAIPAQSETFPIEKIMEKTRR